MSNKIICSIFLPVGVGNSNQDPIRKIKILQDLQEPIDIYIVNPSISTKKKRLFSGLEC